MAKLKHTFVRGRMNKDIDERMLPNGEYRDALNIQVATSEGSNVGAIENILGNTKKNLKALPNTEWDLGFGLTNPVCIGGTRDAQNDKIYWFITSDGIPSQGIAKVDAILEYDKATNLVAPILVDKLGVLNFSADYLITGINILDGLLYWTDNLNEPKVINIATFKAGSDQGVNTDLSVHTQIYGRNFIEKDTTVITETPGDLFRVRAFPSLIGGDGTGISPITINATSGFYGKETSDVVSVSWTNSGSILNWPANSRVILTTSIEQSTGDVFLYQVIGVFSSLVPNAVGGSLNIETITPDIPGNFLEWEMLLIEDDPIFKNDFPRFSYRYRYTDGRYSTYAPFSNAAFVPGKFEYLSRDGNNEGMNSIVRKITIDQFPTPPANVEEIELVYKGAASNNIYLIETFDNTFPASFDITSGLLGAVIESNQILRLFDNVPKRAKGQEIIANRIVYGNYLQNHDVNASEINLSASEYSVTHNNIGYGLPSVKTDREYQLGVSFIDAYDRESPVFTSSGGGVIFNSENSSLQNSIEATLLAGSAPDWAEYFKYYIKNNTPEYYNLALDKYYDAEDGGVWLSFPSSERNKLVEGQYIRLKKQHDSDLPVKFANQYKALNISNEAPDHLAFVETAIARARVIAYDNTSYSKFTVGSNRAYFYGPNGTVPDKNDGQPQSGANYTFFTGVAQGNYIRFSSASGDGKSTSYAILEGGPTGATYNLNGIIYSEYEVILDKDLQIQDSWLASLNTNDEFRATIFEKKKRPLPEFNGRFFVKINPNATFFDNVYSAFSDLTANYIEDIQLSIRSLADNNISSGDTGTYWDDDESVTAIKVLPGSVPSSLDIFRIFVVRTDGTPGAAADQVEYKLTLGTKIKFSYANGTISPNYYTIIDRVHSAYNRTIGNGDGIRYDFQVDRDFDDPQYNSTPTDTEVTGIIIYKEVTKTTTTVLSSSNPAVFETEPEELADLDIYWEASGKIATSRFDVTRILDWHNCYSFGNGVESDRIRDDFNAPMIGKGVRVNAELKEPYKEERRKAGLIYSGIYNNLAGVNETNQFIAGLKITKDLDPVYGGIQKLFARDTNLLAFAEDKVYAVLADKDALFNADGNANLLSTNKVLGNASTFAGEFGISKNPESFASYGFRIYFTDKARGAVLRLSNDGITEISEKGMTDFFADAFASNTTPIIGSFDESTSAYNIKLNNESVSYKERVDGWPTRLSFDPEFAVSLNNEYYTFKNGEIWEHSNQTRNRFYNTQYPSSVTTIFNDSPSSIKNFKTLSYEGTPHWVADVSTDKQNGGITSWRNNEGIYHNFIKGENLSLAVVNGELNSKDFSVQGLGEITAHIPGAPYTIEVGGDVNVSLSIGDTLYIKRGVIVLAAGPVTNVVSNRIEFTDSGVAPQVGEYAFFLKSNQINTSGLLGYYADITFTNASTDFAELFAINSEVFISSE